jgi:hypothetical protein
VPPGVKMLPTAIPIPAIVPALRKSLRVNRFAMIIAPKNYDIRRYCFYNS